MSNPSPVDKDLAEILRKIQVTLEARKAEFKNPPNVKILIERDYWQGAERIITTARSELMSLVDFSPVGKVPYIQHKEGVNL